MKNILLLILLFIASVSLNAQRIDPRQVKKADSLLVTNPIGVVPDQYLYDVLAALVSGSGTTEVADGVTILGDGTGGNEFRVDSLLFVTFQTLTDSLNIVRDSLQIIRDSLAALAGDGNGIISELPLGAVYISSGSNTLNLEGDNGTTTIRGDLYNVRDLTEDLFTEIGPSSIGFYDNISGGSLQMGPFIFDGPDLNTTTLGNFTLDSDQDTTGLEGYKLGLQYGQVRLLPDDGNGIIDALPLANVSINSSNYIELISGTDYINFDYSGIYVESSDGSYGQFEPNNLEVSNSVGDYTSITTESLIGENFTTVQLGNYNFHINQDTTGLVGYALIKTGSQIELSPIQESKVGTWTTITSDPGAAWQPVAGTIYFVDNTSAGWTQDISPTNLLVGQTFYVELIASDANNFTLQATTGGIIRTSGSISFTPSATKVFTDNHYFLEIVWDGSNFRILESDDNP